MQSAHFLFSLQIQNREDTVASLGQSDLEVNVVLLRGEGALLVPAKGILSLACLL